MSVPTRKSPDPRVTRCAVVRSGVDIRNVAAPGWRGHDFARGRVGDRPDVGAKRHLHRSALEYASACGAPDAGEQAELIALRLFRDGVVALRGEIEARRQNPAAASAPLTPAALAVETIDALLILHGKVPT